VASAGAKVASALYAWCRALPRPLVIFLDEIDALRDTVLLSVLRQLRDGYNNRPQGFPSSLGLVGMRDVRDYKIASGGSTSLHTSSPFNIKVRSLTLGNFTAPEVTQLYQQHTDATGQRFEPAALERVFALTHGQPWLVNALANELTGSLVPDAAEAISAAHVDRAKDLLIQRQDTHLDRLAERLREPRVRAVIEPMLAGTSPGQLPSDDIRFVLDLGLVRWGVAGNLEPANAIYKEVLVRSLADSPRAALPAIQPTWLRADRTLDPSQLLAAFVAFWRQHGEPLLQTAPYHQIAPHLVLMAFLHRVVNGGGHLDREYAIGSGRMDLLLTYGEQKLAMELKVWRPRQPDPKAEGFGATRRVPRGAWVGHRVVGDLRSSPAATPSRRAHAHRNGHQPRGARRRGDSGVSTPGPAAALSAQGSHPSEIALVALAYRQKAKSVLPPHHYDGNHIVARSVLR